MPHAFEILEIPPSFELSNKDLRKAFIKLSAKYHPDRATSDEEREAYEAQASQINQAHTVLKNVEQRANLLLDILGGPSASEDKSLPPTLLMDMLEVKEELEEARGSNDSAALKKIQDQAITDRDALLEGLAGQFSEALSTQTPDSQALKKIRLGLNELRYLERLIEQSSEDFDLNQEH